MFSVIYPCYVTCLTQQAWVAYACASNTSTASGGPSAAFFKVSAKQSQSKTISNR